MKLFTEALRSPVHVGPSSPMKETASVKDLYSPSSVEVLDQIRGDVLDWEARLMSKIRPTTQESDNGTH